MEINAKNYMDFLRSKKIDTPICGVNDNIGLDINPMLFDFQKVIVERALRIGKYAIFADCGLGKSFMQIEWAKNVNSIYQMPVLILCPLAVSYQTILEAQKLNVNIVRFEQGHDIENKIYIANYEQLDNIDCSLFGGIVLDESSILKNYTGATKRKLIESFKSCRFKLCCTATPAPNDYMELGNHSEFLDVMASSEMLTRWFINDTKSTGTYRLKGHSIADFWDWVNSWATCISQPSDLGFDDTGYILPKMNKHKIIVDGDIFTDTKGALFRLPEVNATTLHSEKRKSLSNRVNEVKKILDSDKINNFIIWCDTDYEAIELLDQLAEYADELVEVRGSEKQSVKEQKLLDFTTGHKRIIITKPRIGGLGLNWQHCHKMIFAGIGFSFEYYYQCTKRVHRFGQKSDVDIYLVMGENESNIYDVLMKKETQFEQMKREMFEACIRQASKKSEVKVMYEAPNKANFSLFGRFNNEVSIINAAKTDKFEVFHSDCIEFLKQTPDNWIDFSIYSPPFAQLYIYSDSVADMGNCDSDEEFFEQYKFLIKEKLRCTRPGRLTAVHCKDLPYYQNSSENGDSGIKDFSGQIIQAHIEAGWTFHSRITIWKCPVMERARSNPQRLLYKTLRTDASKCGQGLAEYLLIFRKWGGDTADMLPVLHEDGKPTEVPLSVWQKWASPVWLDINQMNVLNINEAKDSRDEKHICPLQLDVIERSVKMWTNPDEIVFSPFMGIGSEGHEAIRAGRRFVGTELKEGYFKKAIRNLNDISNQAVDLFARAEQYDIGKFGAGNMGKAV